MSNTRHATQSTVFRQEKFASSQEFERGLMANLVVKRCSVLERAEDRELIWFIQLLSHQPGGLKKLAADLMAQFPERIAADSMRKYGTKTGQIYSAEQVRIVRDEISGHAFPLKGEIDLDGLGMAIFLDDNHEQQIRARQEARFHPTKYPAEVFVKCCREAAAAGLEKHLKELCLDPAMPAADGAPWYFPTLVSTLREFMAAWIAERAPAVITSIGEKVADALDYAMESRRMVIVDGLPRRGKTYAAKSWYCLHPGSARYIECPCGNDDFSFFREIALSLGVSVNLKSKAQELRGRVEETLRGGDLALVIDQAHWLWPQSHYRNTTPSRINWVMMLVDQGVAVSLIVTPQFFRSKEAIEKTSCWAADQFIGRIGHYEKLPDALSPDDLHAVASVLLPGGNSDSVKALALYAQSSGKYLGGMDAIAERARFICKKDGRQKIEFRDVKRAIQESVTPSDEALKAALANASGQKRRRAASVVATPLQSAFEAPATSLPVEQIP
jgi:AAA domain